MSKLSFKFKIVFLILSICSVIASVTYITLGLKDDIAQSYKEIGTEQLPKVQITASLIADFRLIRINVRTLGLSGNTETDLEKYTKLTHEAIESFLKNSKQLKMFKYDDKEKEFLSKMDSGWESFHKFGKDLLSKYQNPTEDSLREGSDMVRLVCPVEARKWMDVAKAFLEYQTERVNKVLEQSLEEDKRNQFISNLTLILTFSMALLFSFLFASKISNKIQMIVKLLAASVSSVTSSSDDISISSAQLSESATEAASSLQETVSSIDEISSMIQRNADAANNSAQVSTKSSEAANRGKQTVESMIKSINDISKSNDEIASEMQRNNEDISKIVQVISEIGEKTKVINDIVFQTKLLSFNASVEAARAGEHGKGFAVVAEEVGNLASMSGKAALEITEMLDSSIHQVKSIVETTKKKVETLVTTSKEKVDTGTKTAHECEDALDEILHNVTSVNEMVREIASASSEQSTGVKEVTQAMQQLDQTTHQNTSVAQESSTMAQKLKTEADGLNQAVLELTAIVNGSKKTYKLNVSNEDLGHEAKVKNVIELPRKTKLEEQTSAKEISSLKVSGLDTEIPDESDERFEDL